MVFSNENINKFREKAATIISQPTTQESLSKVSTTTNITDAINNPDIESDYVNHWWFFGIQTKTYPYQLITFITGCLESMGFVLSLLTTIEMEI
jgi:hypothetical protein